MGIVNFGIPEKEAKWLKERLKLTTAVEGGTYLGGTALRLSELFQTVYTIEKSDVMIEMARNNTEKKSNITLLRGDTRDHLQLLVSDIDNVLFWLDAHWSGGETYGEQDECPLLKELDVIFNSPMKNYAILIDDARLFLAPPPLPHLVENWPSIKLIADIIPTGFDMLVHEDVIYIVTAEIETPLYLQGKTTSNWLKYAEVSYPTFKNYLKGLIMSVRAKFKST